MLYTPRFLLAALITTVVSGCQTAEPPGPEGAQLEGVWRAVLASPGGELPFTLTVEDGPEGLTAHALSAGEEEPFSAVRQEGERVIFEVSWYDSEIETRLVGADRLEGGWRKTGAGGEDSRLAFFAERGSEVRFASRETAGFDVSGEWTAEFVDEDGTFPARAELAQSGDRVTGTILTATGDYRFLEGRVEGQRLRLSTFDGAHAFLFDATLGGGEVLTGDFWSRDKYHATWTARRASPEDALPDPFAEVGLTDPDRRFRFSFPDLEGEIVSIDDERFAGKPVLVDIFGTWCPNCNDAAPLIAQWAEEYGPKGLEVVGLAYEYTGDAERDAEMVRRYVERHDAHYVHLLAGTSDKAQASETLPDLTEILAFPTLVFLDREHRVVRVYSGFAGPGTGEHFDLLREQLVEILQELTADSAATAAL